MKINNKSELKGMRYPALNDLISKANNKYELVLATAKRAREIVDGSSPLVPIKIDNAISIATEEIDEDLVKLNNPYFKDGSPVKPLIDSDSIPKSTAFSSLPFESMDIDSDLSAADADLDEMDDDEDHEADEDQHGLSARDDEEAPFDLSGREDVDAEVDILMQDIYGDTINRSSDYDDDMGN